MFFESANPSIIRSVKQRDLLNTWLRLRGRCSGLPPVAEYHPARLEEEMRELVYYVVKRDGDEFRFVIDSNGSTSALAYGTSHNNNIGTDLSDYLPANMRPLVLPLYGECAKRALPTYTVSLVKDINGRSVVHERLLLPFFKDGRISHIIASLKSISEDGKFEINNLLRDPDKLPEYKIRAVIDRDLVVGQAAREARHLACDYPAARVGDVVEI
jgi:hypothetical protein